MIAGQRLEDADVKLWIEKRRQLALDFLSKGEAGALLPFAQQHELAPIIQRLSEPHSDPLLTFLGEAALEVRHQAYGNQVFFRGLIEFTNYCKNDCYYCGISRSQGVHRYRLTNEEILACCETGESLGYHSFVLQGGEDPYFNDDRMCQVVALIRQHYPNNAITLSLGERSKSSYERLFAAGANRYLLRHETANSEHYSRLHPPEMTLTARKSCLNDLKAVGFQVGAGFMVGSPFQTVENLEEDLVFLQDFKPHMVGIGPFIPAGGTPFEREKPGTLRQTLVMLGLTRLLLPKVLLPSTTALGTIDPMGREKGFDFGANVVMPNLSPTVVRGDYNLYDNKLCIKGEAQDQKDYLVDRILKSGNRPDLSRGDHADFVNKKDGE